MMKRNILTLSLSVLLASCLVSCAVGPDYKASPVDAPQAFNTQSNRFSDSEIEKAFWKRFDDVLLNTLIDDAVRSNHDIKIAVSNLAEAKALARDARAQLLPTILANASYKDSLDAANQTRQPNPTRSDREFRSVIASVDMTWELDFAGRLRRASEASLASGQAVEAQLDDVMISMVAEVARNYFELRGLQRELQGAKDNVANLVETQKIVDARVDAGAGTGLDMARAKSILDSSRATIPQLEIGVSRVANRLAVLTGKRPGVLTAQLGEAKPLAMLSRVTAIGSPDALLKRRPDVRAAERELAAATARIGVAVADYYPRISIGGDIGINAKSGGDLSSESSRFWSFGPKLTWAFLDSGRIRANINRAEARADVALARFDKTVLIALEETENALSGYSQSLAREEALYGASGAAQEATKLAKLRFEAGASDFLTLLDAERTRIAADREYDQAKAATATSLVAVYKALAGGF
jgi:outer membrane protein, multidrug efflux system